VLRGGEPVLDNLLKLLSGHAGMRGHDNLQHRPFVSSKGPFHVALEQRGEGFLVFPFRMLNYRFRGGTDMGELSILAGEGLYFIGFVMQEWYAQRVGFMTGGKAKTFLELPA
jgi:hypothetical protein